MPEMKSFQNFMLNKTKAYVIIIVPYMRMFPFRVDR